MGRGLELQAAGADRFRARVSGADVSIVGLLAKSNEPSLAGETPPSCTPRTPQQTPLNSTLKLLE